MRIITHNQGKRAKKISRILSSFLILALWHVSMLRLCAMRCFLLVSFFFLYIATKSNYCYRFIGFFFNRPLVSYDESKVDRVCDALRNALELAGYTR